MAKPRILLVDDHPVIRQAVRQLLAKCPYDICGEAGEGTDALEMAKALEPDLVLLDVSMPGMTGIEVLHEIRHLEFQTKIIFFTVHDRDYLKGFGADAIVTKSEDPGVLIQTIDRVLGPHAGQHN